MKPDVGERNARSRAMTKKIILLALCSLLLAPCSAVQAQQVSKIPRIGIVTGISTDPSSRIKIFRQELQDLGYFEGKNILFEFRDNEGDRSRVPGIVAELVRLKVDVLFSTQAIVIREAKQATRTIPIVMAITPDPVASGLVDSLARPGKNYRVHVSDPRTERQTAGTTDRDDSAADAGRNSFGLRGIQRL
jgi:putative ABC transport system substrate-binding protein